MTATMHVIQYANGMARSVDTSKTDCIAVALAGVGVKVKYGNNGKKKKP